jgi:hypothetical protein
MSHFAQTGNLCLRIEMCGRFDDDRVRTDSGEASGRQRRTFPIAQVSPLSADFGTVAVGSTEDVSLMVNNVGTAPLTVSGLTAAGAGFGQVAHKPELESCPPQ